MPRALFQGTPRRSVFAALARLTLVATGATCLLACARNGVLEVHLDAPAELLPSDLPYLELSAIPVQDLASAESIVAPDTTAVVPASQLVDGVDLSVVAEQFDANVAIRLRFCASERCDAIEDASPPRLLYVLERPIWRGVISRWERRVSEAASPDASAICVSRCAVRACVTAGMAASYCGPDGVHVCGDTQAPGLCGE